jgi:KilA-N domain
MDTMKVQGLNIRLKQVEGQDYISLTDIANHFGNNKDPEGARFLISNWMRNRDIFDYLGLWEELNNPNFNRVQFDTVKNKEIGKNAFRPTPKMWTEQFNGIGIYAKSGRYDSGTYAHTDIAFDFAMWLNPVVKLHIITEFQRLKKEETFALKEKESWSLKRELSKLNYLFHTEAIKTHIIEPKNLPVSAAISHYSSEADMLNRIVFGLTASEWRNQNSEKKGNLRDFATENELHLLSNLETHNAEMIEAGMAQYEREGILTALFEKQLNILKSKKPRISK